MKRLHSLDSVWTVSAQHCPQQDKSSPNAHLRGKSGTSIGTSMVSNLYAL